jgi:2-phosphosulfolactate phosphatase
MKTQTLLSPANAEELYFTKKTTVVIDVLRATTTIITALNNGAKEIIPVGSIEFAMKVSGNTFSGHTLLGGERNTKKIEGFALGNSPFEYSPEIVKGKSIILFTTNGSKAIVKAKYSSKLLICSFLNIASLAKQVADSKEIVILCSGNNGLFSYEDAICAGNLIDELFKLNLDVELSDACRTSHLLFNESKNNLSEALSQTEHGTKLIENGFEPDIIYSAQSNIVDIIPFYEKATIQLLK